MKVHGFLKLFKPVDFRSLSVRYLLYSLTIPGLRIRHALLQSGHIIAKRLFSYKGLFIHH